MEIELSPAAHQSYTQAVRLMQSRRVLEALKIAVQAADAEPNSAGAQQVFGALCLRAGRMPDAVRLLRRLVKLQHANAEARFYLAMALHRTGQHDEALQQYERSLALKPGQFDAMAARAELLADLNRDEEARAQIEDLAKAFPPDRLSLAQRVTLALIRSALCPRCIDPADIEPELEQLAHDRTIPPAKRSVLLWRLGRIAESRGDDDLAFARHAESKAVAAPPWDADAHSHRVDALIAAWTSPEAEAIPESTLSGSNFVYIVGMLRSGTTLVEQMLAQLSGVVPGGEQSVIRQAAAEIQPPRGIEMPMPTELTSLTAERINALSKTAHARYAERVPARAGSLITDKQPQNYFYLPLIARLMPGARVIHLQRNAQDCCISNFFTSFARPHPETHDLYNLGRFFRDYERLMRAWQSLPKPEILSINYEDLVQRPEPTARQIVEFIGKEWDPGVLEFHISSRTVRTASREQVRQRLYTSAVNRHERYSAHLGELRRGLGLTD